MATKINYQPIIDDIKKSKNEMYILTQDKAKKLINNDLPKSLFKKNYIDKGNNDLARFLVEKCEYETVEPKIIIYKKHEDLKK